MVMIEVDHREIHLHILVNLILRQSGIAIKVLERLIDKMEYLMSESLFHHFFLGRLAYMQMIALHDHLRNLDHLLGHLLRDGNLEFDIVVVLFKPSILLHMLGIIGVIIDCSLGSQLVKAPCEHSLGVEIGES